MKNSVASYRHTYFCLGLDSHNPSVSKLLFRTKEQLAIVGLDFQNLRSY